MDNPCKCRNDIVCRVHLKVTIWPFGAYVFGMKGAALS
jgi:hypothetical protein